jgi:hypothetical protein
VRRRCQLRRGKGSGILAFVGFHLHADRLFLPTFSAAGSTLTIPAHFHDAITRLSPEQRRARTAVNEAVGLGGSGRTAVTAGARARTGNDLAGPVEGQQTRPCGHGEVRYTPDGGCVHTQGRLRPAPMIALTRDDGDAASPRRAGDQVRSAGMAASAAHESVASCCPKRPPSMLGVSQEHQRKLASPLGRARSAPMPNRPAERLLRQVRQIMLRHDSLRQLKLSQLTHLCHEGIAPESKLKRPFGCVS